MALGLSDKAAVEQLLLRVFYALDMRDYAGVVSCFHVDGTWVRMGKRLVGHTQMRQALDQRSKTMLIHHVITNVLFEEADEIRCRLVCYLTAYRHDNGNAIVGAAPLVGPSQVGFCRAEAARDSAAETWRLSYLNADGPTFVSPAP